MCKLLTLCYVLCIVLLTRYMGIPCKVWADPSYVLRVDPPGVYYGEMNVRVFPPPCS
jgi:hypothetical protein